MKPLIFLKNGGLVAAAALLALSVLLWHNPSAAQDKTATDTLPAPRDKKVKDFDDALRELDRAQLEVQKNLKEIDWSQVEKEMQASLKKMEVDMADMKTNMEKAMKEIDKDQIRREVEKATMALKEIDTEKMKADLEASLAKIDTEKMKKEMEKVKAIDMEKLKADMEKMKPQIEKSMKEAQEGIEKARTEIKEYKSFVDELDKAGLIQKNKSYTIENKAGQLIINGKVQPAEVYNQYRSFLEKHPNITIKKTDDDFNIQKN